MHRLPVIDAISTLIMELSHAHIVEVEEVYPDLKHESFLLHLPRSGANLTKSGGKKFSKEARGLQNDELIRLIDVLYFCMPKRKGSPIVE